MDVISLEEGRVILKTDVVLKKSTENEFNNLRNAYNETRKLTGIFVPKEYGYSSSEVVLKIPKIIKKDSITYNNLPYIMSVYLEYNWIQNDNKCYI